MLKRFLIAALFVCAASSLIAGEDYVQLPPNSTGSKLRMRTSTQGANTVYSQAFFLDDGSGSGPLGISSNPIFVNFVAGAAASVSVSNFPSNQAVTIQSNASVNETQIAGTAIDVNSGNKSAGTQRIVIATDQPALTNALKVDGSAVTQPVSGTITANIGTTNGLALDATLTGGSQKAIARGGAKGTTSAGDVTSENVDANTQAIHVFVKNASLAVTGTFWQATQPVSGTVTANIGTSGSLALDASVTGLQVSQGSTTSGQNGGLAQGAVTTSAPTYTTAKTSPLSLTTAGALRVDGSAVTQPVSGTFWQATQPVSGTFWQATQPVSGTVTTTPPANASTNLAQVGGTATVTGGVNGSLGVGGLAASGAAKAGQPVQTGGVFNTTQPTVTTGQMVEQQSTARGAELVATGVDTFNVTVNAALPTGANTIGAVTQASGPWTSNLTQVGGTNVSTGTGAGGAGIPRVTISNDSSLAANQSTNVNQFGGSAVVTGTGAGGSGIPRVTISNDSSLAANQSVNAAQVAGTATSVNTGVVDAGTQRIHKSERVTYGASLTVKTATAAGTGPFFSICGSASKTARIQKFSVGGTIVTAAINGDIVLKKTSAATSGGTATTLTRVPHDSNSAAATVATPNFYTVLATAGTLVGVIDSQMGYFPVTPALDRPVVFDWRSRDESEAPVLRGTAQCMEASFATTTTNAPTLLVSVTWTEE